MLNTNASSSSINKRTQKDFVKENAKVKISSKYAVQNHFASGIYTQHHPSQCNHLLNGQPIHLKKQSAIDGKELVRIKHQENVRDLLVPSTANVYPAIKPVQTIKRIEAKSMLTIDDKKIELQRKYDDRKKLEEECEKRKAHLKEFDKIKFEENSDDRSDSAAEKQKFLDRAIIAQLEETEEFKRVNHLIAAKKCQLTLAAQVAEKKEMWRELRDHDYSVEKSILNDCDRALQLESEHALNRRKSKAKLAEEQKALVNQKERIEKVASKQALEMDRAEVHAKAVENTRLEEEEKKQRIEQLYKTRADIENYKALRETLKNKAREEERNSEMRAAEYMRKKQEKIKKNAEEKRLVKEEKQQKADELLMLQAKLLETRNQQGESKLQRSQEEKEREFRRNAKADALKRKMLLKEVHDARSVQLEEIRRKREMAAEEEKEALKTLMEKMKSEEMEEMRNKERFRIEQEKYRNDIKHQIQQKQLKKHLEDEKARMEYARNQEKQKERIANIESVINTKLVEMQEAQMPLEDIKDIQRKIKSKLNQN